MTEQFRKICVVTGSRAEYGVMYWVLKTLQANEAIELQMVATGTHMSADHGMTHRAIEDDGFRIDKKIDLLLSDDSPEGVARSFGICVKGVAAALQNLRPDVVVVVGDRYEILAAAQAALICRIPLAHIHGGEITEGAMDDAMRHAITKLAALHFVAAEAYRQRVLQMGENPDHVFTVGGPGLDNVFRLTLLDQSELEKSLNFNFGEQFLLVTYHPATLDDVVPGEAVGELLAALDEFEDFKILLTGVNADTGNRQIAERFSAYAEQQPERVHLVSSLGQLRYLSAVKHCAAVVGNSSSGINEVPALHTPTVNIGGRQAGRLRPLSVINCSDDRGAIIEAVRRALHPDFAAIAEAASSPYGDGGASEKIAELLASVGLSGIVRKRFFDLPVENVA